MAMVPIPVNRKAQEAYYQEFAESNKDRVMRLIEQLEVYTVDMVRETDRRGEPTKKTMTAYNKTKKEISKLLDEMEG